MLAWFLSHVIYSRRNQGWTLSSSRTKRQREIRWQLEGEEIGKHLGCPGCPVTRKCVCDPASHLMPSRQDTLESLFPSPTITRPCPFVLSIPLLLRLLNPYSQRLPLLRHVPRPAFIHASQTYCSCSSLTFLFPHKFSPSSLE